jgi:hypothetical protein
MQITPNRKQIKMNHVPVKNNDALYKKNKPRMAWNHAQQPRTQT